MIRTPASARSLGAFWFAGLLIVPVSLAVAAPPKIEGVTPFGVQRGVAFEVTLTGQNLAGNPRLIAPFGFQLAPTPPAGSDATHAKFGVTAAPDTAIGVYPIRVATDDGISNPFLLAVGQLTQIAEKEDNNTPETAQEVSTPSVIEGQSAGNDVDHFRFKGRKGERFVIDASCARIGSGVDPSLRLSKRDQTYVASAEDTPGLLTDARMIVTLPDDGEYVVEIADARYQGGGRPVYRLLIGAVPMAEEIYPISGRRGETVGLELRGGSVNGLAGAASTLNPGIGFPAMFVRAKSDGPLDFESLPKLIVSDTVDLRESTFEGSGPVRGALPVIFQGRIDAPGDEDRFNVVLTPTQKKIRIEVEAAEVGSALDGVLQVLGPKGEVIGNADDTPLPEGGKKGRAPTLISPDPSLVLDVPAGMTEITLALKDLAGRGGVGYPYRIKVEPVVTDFELILPEVQASLPKGGTATIPLAVTRRGWNGPIRVDIPNLPAGVTARPATISDGQVVGSITLTSTPAAAFGVAHLVGVGQAQGPEGPIVSHGSKSLVFAQQATVQTNTMDFDGITAAGALELPVALDAPAGPIEIPHGYGTAIPIKATRKAGADGALAFSIPTPPPGMTVAASNFAEKAVEGTATVNVTTDHPLGPVSVGLIGKGKIGAGEVTISVPLVTLTVVRPVSVELVAPALEVKAGQAIEVKGKIVRKPGFAEPVTVKLDALPAGLKADPVTLTPAQTDFVLKVTADAKAAAAMANPTVGLGFQVAKKDYPFPATPFALKVLPPG